MENQVSDYRYERKYYISDLTVQEINSIVKLNLSMFTEIFSRRYINNIYLDTNDFECYKANVDGCLDRAKYRIRWYGNLYGQIDKPVLEIKIKRGLLGKKQYFSLPSFNLDSNFSWRDLKEEIRNVKMPVSIKENLFSMNPVLLNRYARDYYLSANKKYRITIDRDLNYIKISNENNGYVDSYNISNETILELKYNQEDDTQANRVSGGFPFRVTKSSKYVQGIELIYS